MPFIISYYTCPRVQISQQMMKIQCNRRTKQMLFKLNLSQNLFGVATKSRIVCYLISHYYITLRKFILVLHIKNKCQLTQNLISNKQTTNVFSKIRFTTKMQEFIEGLNFIVETLIDDGTMLLAQLFKAWMVKELYAISKILLKPYTH